MLNIPFLCITHVQVNFSSGHVRNGLAVNDLDHSSIGVDSSIKAIMLFCSDKQHFAPLDLSPPTFRLIQCKWLPEWTSIKSRESGNSNRCLLLLKPGQSFLLHCTCICASLVQRAPFLHFVCKNVSLCS